MKDQKAKRGDGAVTESTGEKRSGEGVHALDIPQGWSSVTSGSPNRYTRPKSNA